MLDQVQRGALAVEDLTAADYERVAEAADDLRRPEGRLRRRAVLAATERLGEAKLATLDHRHAGTMRPRHFNAPELLTTGS